MDCLCWFNVIVIGTFRYFIYLFIFCSLHKIVWFQLEPEPLHGPQITLPVPRQTKLGFHQEKDHDCNALWSWCSQQNCCQLTLTSSMTLAIHRARAITRFTSCRIEGHLIARHCFLYIFLCAIMTDDELFIEPAPLSRLYRSKLLSGIFRSAQRYMF